MSINLGGVTEGIFPVPFLCRAEGKCTQTTFMKKKRREKGDKTSRLMSRHKARKIEKGVREIYLVQKVLKYAFV